MTEIKQCGFWKRNGVYFVGAGLAYVGAFGVNFIHGGSGRVRRDDRVRYEFGRPFFGTCSLFAAYPALKRRATSIVPTTGQYVFSGGRLPACRAGLCPAGQPEGLPDISRGLSVSDTPGPPSKPNRTLEGCQNCALLEWHIL